MPNTDYYEILGISRTATPAQIRAAHRTSARRYHPDTADDGRGDPRQFALVQEAYEVLSVADFRRRYDNKQAAERGETESPAKRRPPKSPCECCKKPVYASQLILYLGRHVCQACMRRKRLREIARPRIGGLAELRWRLRLIFVWMQVHFATMAIILGGLGAIGARLMWVRAQSHHGPPSAPEELADSELENPITGSSHARTGAPIASVDPSEDHPMHPGGK